jgi:uncharacterized membrane-anchored protein
MRRRRKSAMNPTLKAGNAALFRARRGTFNMKMPLIAAAALLAISTIGVEAKTFREMFPNRKFETSQERQFVESLDYKTGVVPLGATGVQLNVHKAFYFLAPEHARRVITDAWGNPPVAAENVLGMILPSDKTPIDDTWGAIIRFDEDGYVSDEDAESIDYTNLLKEMQESTALGSEERVKQGFESIRLVGWASPPYYDKATHKLHWAKEVEFGGQPRHTLNYDIRALGRKGVLNMNFVADMGQLSEIKGVIPVVMAMPEFTSGFRYEDYVPGADKVAAYGIGGLIAGKVLSKAGFLVIALAFLKKGWILIVLALGGLWQLAMRFFRSTPRA